MDYLVLLALTIPSSVFIIGVLCVLLTDEKEIKK